MDPPPWQLAAFLGAPGPVGRPPWAVAFSTKESLSFHGLLAQHNQCKSKGEGSLVMSAATALPATPLSLLADHKGTMFLSEPEAGGCWSTLSEMWGQMGESILAP